MMHDDSVLSDAELDGVVGGASTVISAATFNTIWNTLETRKPAVFAAGQFAQANGIAGGADAVKLLVDRGSLSVTQITETVAGKTVTNYSFTPLKAKP